MDERKNGRRKESLDDEATDKVLKVAKSLIRTDFGGKDPLGVLKKKAEEKGLKLGPLTLTFVKEIAEEQVESCRKRAFPRIDEAIRRTGKKGPGNGSPFESAP